MTELTQQALPDPRPASTNFWDKVAENYARSPIRDEASYQIKLAKTRAYMSPNMDVLEFGCGTGSTAIVHAPFVHQIRAVDISGKMLEIARQRAKDAGVGNISFQQSDIAALPASDGAYDIVMGMSIVHLLKGRVGAFAKIHKMLKPGGVFISSTVCLSEGLWFLWPFLKLGHAIGYLPFVRFLSARVLLREIAEAGFEIEHHWRPGAKKAIFIVARKRR